MPIKDLNQHIDCCNYRKDSSINHFNIVNFNNTKMSYSTKMESTILFLLDGEIVITKDCVNFIIHDKEMIVIPPFTSVFINSNKAEGICYRFSKPIQFCSELSLEQLFDFSQNEVYPKLDISKLTIDSLLYDYLCCVKSIINEGVHCMQFHEALASHIFIIIRAFYSKNELRAFFNTLLTKNMEFKSYILENCDNIDNNKVIAEKLNMSLSTFNRKFRESFNESPHKWLTRIKAEKIYKELVSTDSSLTEIAYNNNFSSISYLVTFCRHHFNDTPNGIRIKGGVQNEDN